MEKLRQTIRDRFLSNVRGDLLGGLTAAIVALPIALGFGVASGLGAAAGLYGAIACGIFASLFGGTPGQVSGPTGPLTVVAATIVAAHTGRPELVFAALILGGFLQVGLGVLGAGRLVRYIPYPVVSGFMTGIGVIIILLQLNPLLGLAGTGSVLDAIEKIPALVTGFSPAAMLVGLGTLALVYLLPCVWPRVPAALVALVVVTAASMLLGAQAPRIGSIPSGFPFPHLPAIGFVDLKTIVSAAIYLALLGSIDSLLTSVIMDRMTGRRHNSDQELIGQGIGNAVSGMIGGLPGAGATMRSVVNARAGGRTYLSGAIHGVVLLSIVLGLGQLASYIPLACLAAILINVGIGIVDYRGIKNLLKAPRSDAVVLLVVLFLTIFADLIIAVGAGFILACVLFVRKLGESNLAQHGSLADSKEFEAVAGQLPLQVRHAVYIYSLKGPFFFGEVENFRETMEKLPGVRYVALCFSAALVVDQSGAYALEEVSEQLKAMNISMLLVGVQPAARETLTRLGVLEKIGPNNCFDDLGQAVQRISCDLAIKPDVEKVGVKP